MTKQDSDAVWQRDEIESPCVKLCTVHPVERICVGCYRSMEEIGAWGRMTPETRREIMKDLPSRAARLGKRRGGRAARTGQS